MTAAFLGAIPPWFDPLPGVLIIPLAAAAALALVPGYRISAGLNIAASAGSLICAVTLLLARPEPRAYLLVDDLNIVFILLNSFVCFTTSVFSASYIAHE